MSLASKTFRNNKTGETVRVLDTFENIAILENKQKVDVRTLMDTNQYTEQIDPSTFFNNQVAYNALAEKIKTIPTDNILDESVTNQIGGSLNPSTNESAIIETTEEQEMAELARKYGVDPQPSDALNKQKQAFAKYLDDDQLGELKVNDVKQVPVNKEYTQPDVQRVNVSREPPVQNVKDDPIITMFKNVKRNVDFKISIDILNKIPRLDFIEMMEDSYETSIIDFLADEFTNKILRDPSLIREQFKTEISNLVYGKSGSNKDINKSPSKGRSSKPTVKERVKIINKLESISEIESKISNEKSKTVLEAANNRLNILKQKNKS